MCDDKRYNIAFKGLGDGLHLYEFEVGSDFFESFEGSQVISAAVNVVVRLTKAQRSLSIDFEIKGEVGVECDRCLDEFQMPVEFKGVLEVRFSDMEMSEQERYDGEVMWLQSGDVEVGVAQYIYESVVLGLPYQRVHPQDENGVLTCNPDMLERFKIITQEEFDHMESESMIALAENPQMDKLRQMRDKM